MEQNDLIIMHEKNTFEFIQIQDQQQQQQLEEQQQQQPQPQQQQQQQPRQQQQQQKRARDRKNEEQRKPIMETNQRIVSYNNIGKEEQESMDHNNKVGNENGVVVGPRERLKRHRREVAGQVWIPDMWGQEDFLKDWIDCTSFDSSLVPQNIMLARASLMEEGRRSNSHTLRVENSC